MYYVIYAVTTPIGIAIALGLTWWLVGRWRYGRVVLASALAAVLVAGASAAAVWLYVIDDDGGHVSGSRSPGSITSPATPTEVEDTGAPPRTSDMPEPAEPRLRSTRDVDFSQVPAVEQVMSDRCVLRWFFFGSASSLDLFPCRIGSIQYEDLTNDGREEAVLSIAGLSGQGRLPILAVLVYGYRESTLTQLLFVDSGVGPLWPYVAEGVLAISETTYEPGEPACCPGQTSLSTYEWTGTALVRSSLETLSCDGSHPLFGSMRCPRP